MAVNVTITKFRRVDDFFKPVSEQYPYQGSTVYVLASDVYVNGIAHDSQTKTLTLSRTNDLPDLTVELPYMQSVVCDNSVTGLGSSAYPVQLINDQFIVDNFHFYGTMVGAAKKWQSLKDAIRHILEDPTSGLVEVIENMNLDHSKKDDHLQYMFETTAAGYSRVSDWDTSATKDKMGSYRAVVTIHDLTTHSITVLENVMGVDHTDSSNEVEDDEKVVTDGSMSMTLDFDASNNFRVNLGGMGSNNKRIHMALYKCTLHHYSYILQAETGYFTLTNYPANLIKDTSEELGIGSFSLTGFAAGLGIGITEQLVTGYFGLTGRPARLGKNVQHYTMTAGTGSFTLTGGAVEWYEMFLEFDTTKQGTTYWYINTTVETGTDFMWDMGDGTQYYHNSPYGDHIYADSSTKTVRVLRKISTKPTVTKLVLSSALGTGAMDLTHTAFDDCIGFNISGCPSVTSLTFPSTYSATLDDLSLDSIGLTSLDVSMFDTLNNARMQLNRMSSMTSLTLPSSVTGALEYFSVYQASSMSGTLDLSAFTAWYEVTGGNDCGISLNESGFTGVTLPSSPTGTLGAFYAHDCSLSGTLDLSAFTTWSSEEAVIDISDSGSITGLTLASSITGTFTDLKFYSSGLTGTLNLSGISAFSTKASSPYKGCTVDFHATALTGVTFSSSAISGELYQMSFYNCYSLTSLDLSNISSLSDYAYFRGYNCTSMTSLTMPTSLTKKKIASFDVSNSALTTLDISILDFSDSANIYANGLDSLTSYTFPSSYTGKVNLLHLGGDTLTSLDISVFDMWTTFPQINLQGDSITSLTLPTLDSASGGWKVVTIRNMAISSLDLSGIDFSSSGVSVQIYQHPNLTSVTFPGAASDPVTFSSLLMHSNTSLLSLDISTLDFENGTYYQIYGHGSMTSLTYRNSYNNSFRRFYGYDQGSIPPPDFSTFTQILNQNSTYIDLHNCGYSTAEVNKVLYDLANYCEDGYTGRTINLTQNSAPDNSSGGYDGLGAKTALQNLGVTVNTA